MSYCTKCGQRLKDGASFCSVCGASVKTEGAESLAQEHLRELPANSPAPPHVYPPEPSLSATPPALIAKRRGYSDGEFRRNVELVLISLALTISILFGYGVIHHQIEIKHQILLSELASNKTRATEVDQSSFSSACNPESRCVGKFIVWTGIVQENEPTGATSLEVKSGNGSANIHMELGLESPLNAGDQVLFHGVIRELNIISPDEIDKGYIRKVIATGQQLAAAEAQHEAALAAEAAKPDGPEVLNSAEALDKKYGTSGIFLCAAQADDYLRSIAKYDFKWENIGFLETKFDTYIKNVKSPGVLTLESDKAQLQNGFGAYQRIELYCDYDTQRKEVLGFETTE